jgi:hypothetical protein
MWNKKVYLLKLHLAIYNHYNMNMDKGFFFLSVEFYNLEISLKTILRWICELMVIYIDRYRYARVNS